MSRWKKKKKKKKKGGGGENTQDVLLYSVFLEWYVVHGSRINGIHPILFSDGKVVDNDFDLNRYIDSEDTEIIENVIKGSDGSLISVKLRYLPAITAKFLNLRSSVSGEKILRLKKRSAFWKLYQARNRVVHEYDSIFGRVGHFHSGRFDMLEVDLKSLNKNKARRSLLIKNDPFVPSMIPEFKKSLRIPEIDEEEVRRNLIIATMIIIANSVLTTNKKDFHEFDEYKYPWKNNENGFHLQSQILGKEANWIQHIQEKDSDFFKEDQKNKIESLRITFRERWLLDLYKTQYEEKDISEGETKHPSEETKKIIKMHFGRDISEERMMEVFRDLRRSYIGKNEEIKKKIAQHYLHSIGKLDEEKTENYQEIKDNELKIQGICETGFYAERFKTGYVNTLGSMFEFFRNKVKYSERRVEKFGHQYWGYKVETVSKLLSYFPGLEKSMLEIGRKYEFMKVRMNNKFEVKDFNRFFTM